MATGGMVSAALSGDLPRSHSQPRWGQKAGPCTLLHHAVLFMILLNVELKVKTLYYNLKFGPRGTTLRVGRNLRLIQYIYFL